MIKEILKAQRREEKRKFLEQQNKKGFFGNDYVKMIFAGIIGSLLSNLDRLVQIL